MLVFRGLLYQLCCEFQVAVSHRHIWQPALRGRLNFMPVPLRRFSSRKKNFIAMELTAEDAVGRKSGLRCSRRVSGLITVALTCAKWWGVTNVMMSSSAVLYCLWCVFCLVSGMDAPTRDLMKYSLITNTFVAWGSSEPWQTCDTILASSTRSMAIRKPS